jgi:thioredoxin-related protein
MAFAFLNNNFQMPAMAIFDEKNNLIGVINGYWSKNQLIPLIDYFYDNSYKKISFQEYLKNYKS